LLIEPLFADRLDAGRQLGLALAGERGPDTIVVGLARGGVQVAAEVARALAAPLDVVAVRKVGHPLEPEYALGAVTPGEGVYLRAHDGLSDEQLAAAVRQAQARADELDRELHAGRPPLDPAGKNVIVVDDGLATGATLVAALRWARSREPKRLVAAVPVASVQGAAAARAEADELVCPYVVGDLGAVGLWYGTFAQVGNDEVLRLLEAAAPAPTGQ